MGTSSSSASGHLHHIIYASAASVPFDVAAINDLLEASRRKNRQLDLTGMLLYDDGSFLQVLEGPEAAVDATFARIRLDPRHREVVTIKRGAIQERGFSSWGMGFGELRFAELQRALGGLDHFTRAQRYTDLSATFAERVLHEFSHGQWRSALHRYAGETSEAS